MASAAIRGKMGELYGYTDFAVRKDEFREQYLRLVGHAAAGEIVFDIATYPFERIAEAWDKINGAARDAHEYNLERKPLVFNVFGWLAEAARG